MDHAEDRNNLYFVFLTAPHGVDPATHVIIQRLCGELGVAYEKIIDKISTPNLARYYNRCYMEAHHQNPGTVVSMVGDDMVFRTHGWEVRLLEAIERFKGIGVFYCAGDERFDDALCVNGFWTRQFVDQCGGWPEREWPGWVGKYNLQWGEAPFMCPVFPANGIDVVWQLIGDATETSRYLADVIIKHNQWSRPEVGQDETSVLLSGARKATTRKLRRDEVDVEAANSVIRRLHEYGIGDGKDCRNLHKIVRSDSGQRSGCRWWITKDKVWQRF